jgi:hypothetical protein
MKTSIPWTWLFWLVWLGGYGLQAQAHSRLQRPLPLSFQDLPLPEALTRIEAETDIRFSFRSGLLPVHQRVSLRYEQTLASALDIWFDGTGLRYQEIGGTITLYQQASQVLSGYVVDEATGERLPYAKVWDLRSGQGTVANAFGFFSLSLPTQRDSAQLMGSFLEYLSKPQALSLSTDQPLELRLKPYLAMDAVDIEEKRDSNGPDEVQMSTLVLPVGEVNNLPALLGEPDVVRAIQLLPGVQRGNEGSTDLFVRGGGRDQNLVLLDGVPLYYLDNRRSPVSIFNPDVLQDVRLTKGGFPARFGGRLSSVMEVSMREGNRKEARFSASIGLLTVKASAEGPIGPKNEAGEAKTSYLFSARRNHFDLFGQGLVLLGVERFETGTDYSFYDFNAKLTHNFSERDRLYLSGYLGQDRDISSSQPSTRWRTPTGRLGIGDTAPSPDAIRIDQQWNFRNVWGNAMGSLRWNHLWSERAFSNLSLSYSRNQSSTQSESVFQFTSPGDSTISASDQRRFTSDIQAVILRWEMDWFPHPAHQVKWGAQATWHGFQPLRRTRQLQFDQEIVLDTEVGDGLSSGYEGLGFVEHDWRVTERFRLHTGLHATAYRFRQQTYASLQPRVSARYLLRPQLALKASYAEMQQFVHLLPGGWIPATDRVPPAYSRQVATGLAWTSPQGVWGASLEGYYKRMTDLIDYQEGWYPSVAGVGPRSDRWESLIETGGTGEAYGAELLLEKKQGRLRGWLGYTLAWNWRQFANINGGERFPARFDRRHNLSLVALHTLKPGIELSGSWGLGIGDPFTIATGWHSSWVQDQDAPAPPDPSLTVPQNAIFLYEEGRNNVRMRAFHRLDIGISLSKGKPWGSRTWRFGVTNLYNRLNPAAYSFQRIFGNEPASTPGLFQQSIYPILPSVSYGINF